MIFPASFHKRATFAVIAAPLLVVTASPAGAQDSAATGLVDALAACRAVAAAEERLACYDRASAALVAASESGEVQVVGREDIRKTRRGLFGFSLPRTGLFGGDGGAEETAITSTITQARRVGREEWLITIEEGSVWRVGDAPQRFRPRAGSTVEIERAAMGSFWIRVDGTTGVKGRRVE